MKQLKYNLREFFMLLCTPLLLAGLVCTKVLRRRHLWISFLTIPVLIFCCNSKAERDKEGKGRHNRFPNIIVVFGDQWRAQSVGYAGNTDVLTPNLDKLAKESIVFKTAVSVDPVCAPFRASLITGQFPTTHGIFYNDKPLKNDAVTIAEICKKAGYNTGYIGKWHLNGHLPGEQPFSQRGKPIPKSRRQGFDYWKVREVSHDYNNSFYFDENNEKHTWKGYDAFAQTDTAIDYIQKMSVRDEPFLLFLSWGPPHSPYDTAPEKYTKMYNPDSLLLRKNVPDSLGEESKKMLAGYYAHCTALDDAMGRLLASLQKEHISDNTIVVFTSDHGSMLLSRGVQKKQKPWDESLLVPLLIRYPAKLSHKEIMQPINTPDILPTLLGLGNIDIPGSVQGKDFSKALEGKEEYTNESALIQFPVPFHQWNFSNGGREYRGIRTSQYTYVKDLDGPWLMYDNEKDPFQQENLVGIGEYYDVQKSLDKILSEKLNSVNDEFLSADEYMHKWGYLYDFKDSLRN